MEDESVNTLDKDPLDEGLDVEPTVEPTATLTPQQALEDLYDVDESESDIDIPSASDVVKKDPEPDTPDPEGESAPPQAEGDFSLELLVRAERAGLSKEEALNFGEPQYLERSLNLYDKGLDQARQAPAVPTQPGATVAPKDEEGTQEKKSLFDYDALKENFDPELVDTFQKLESHYEGRLGEMQNQLNEVISATQQRDNDRLVLQLDRLITDLGPEYEPFVGKGGLDSLGKNSKEYATRNEIFATMDDLAEGRARRGEQALSERDLMSKAKGIVLSDQTETIARNNLNGKIAARRSQSLSRPTNKSGKQVTLSPTKEAEAFVADMMTKLGEDEAAAPEQQDSDGI